MNPARSLAAACSLIVLLPGVIVAGSAAAQEWWRFRGPNGTGVSEALALPSELDASEPLWSRPVPRGRSSPILVDGRLYLTGLDSDRLVTLALSAETGDELWRAELERSRRDGIYGQNDSASATPTSDGESLYVFFTELGLVSLDLEGRERWRVELGPFDNFYGVAASPVVSAGLVLLLVDQVRDSFLLAVDAGTGQERWRAERPGRIESWTTPVLYPGDAPRQALVFGSGWLDAYDLATGEPAWSLPGMGGGPVASPALEGSRLVVASPNHAEQPLPAFASLAPVADADADGRMTAEEFAAIEGLSDHFAWLDRDGDGALTEPEYEEMSELIATTPYGLVAIDLPVVGSREAPQVAWSQQQSVAYIASPAIADGIVFMVRDGGIVSSVDLETGEVIRRARSSRAAGEVFASPVVADGKVFVASLGGELAVLSGNGEWEVLVINEFDEPIYATPVPAPGRLYVRTDTRLMAFAPGE